MKNVIELLNEHNPMYALLACKDSKLLSDSADYMLCDKESIQYMFDLYADNHELDKTSLYVREVELTNEVTPYRCFVCCNSDFLIYREESYDTYCIYVYDDVDTDYLIDTLTLNCFHKENHAPIVLSCFIKLKD